MTVAKRSSGRYVGRNHCRPVTVMFVEHLSYSAQPLLTPCNKHEIGQETESLASVLYVKGYLGQGSGSAER